ncbi:hypothetical protein [Rhodococcus oxybenzonivorans]|uniref:hypothetical protein n=1 Tax=Rhodococcus TaxID=1827 RepID=UPI0037C8FB81
MTIAQGLRTAELPAAAVISDTAVFPDLSEAVAARIGRAMAESRSEGTRRTYASAWRRFEQWCHTHGHASLPAHPATVAAYLVDAADTIGSDGIRVRRRALQAGFDPALVTQLGGHSLRAGFVTQAFNRTVIGVEWATGSPRITASSPERWTLS